MRETLKEAPGLTLARRPANPAYTADELRESQAISTFVPLTDSILCSVYQIQTSHSSLLIVFPGSISVAEEAAKKAGLSSERIVVFDERGTGRAKEPKYPTVGELVRAGLKRPPAFVEKKLEEGEATRMIAYLCFSSGTTGRPKVQHSYSYLIIVSTWFSRQSLSPIIPLFPISFNSCASIVWAIPLFLAKINGSNQAT